VVFVVNNYKSKNFYTISILISFCDRRLKSTPPFCLLSYFHNCTGYLAKIIVCKQVVHSLQYKRSSKQLNSMSWTLLVLKLYGLGCIRLITVQYTYVRCTIRQTKSVTTSNFSEHHSRFVQQDIVIDPPDNHCRGF